MPAYRCPLCGRVVEVPKAGTYYCKQCGPHAVMERYAFPKVSEVLKDERYVAEVLKPEELLERAEKLSDELSKFIAALEALERALKEEKKKKQTA